MLNDHFFRVADYTFRVSLPDSLQIERMLPPFADFRVPTCCGEPLFHFTAEWPARGIPAAARLIDETYNDMGHTVLHTCERGGYLITLWFGDDETQPARLYATDDFRRVWADIPFGHRYAVDMLNSLLRMTYSQAVLTHWGISIHASAVVIDGKAYLFMGKSGTGKSTHAVQWMKRFPSATLLNDDNPTLRYDDDGRVVAYGTPWSGKTPCYKNEHYPVGGIVRLVQASVNRFESRTGITAFTTILPGCSAMHHNYILRNCMYDTLLGIAEKVTVGQLECRPDAEAAEICARALGALSIDNN